jgi:hypothetical protein
MSFVSECNNRVHDYSLNLTFKTGRRQEVSLRGVSAAIFSLMTGYHCTVVVRTILADGRAELLQIVQLSDATLS